VEALPGWLGLSPLRSFGVALWALWADRAFFLACVSCRSARHPGAAFFHVFFKALAIFFFMFSSWMGLSDFYIFVTIVCILLHAADFWTVKNVTGRLLVGLRWWNMIKPDGSTEWVYESLDNMAEVDKNDSRVFWWALYGTPVVWTVFLLYEIILLHLEWLIIIGVALTLNGANIIGYTRCSREAQRRVSSFVQDTTTMAGAMNVLNNTAMTGFFMSALGVNTNSNAAKSRNSVGATQNGTAFV